MCESEQKITSDDADDDDDDDHKSDVRRFRREKYNTCSLESTAFWTENIWVEFHGLRFDHSCTKGLTEPENPLFYGSY